MLADWEDWQDVLLVVQHLRQGTDIHFSYTSACESAGKSYQIIVEMWIGDRGEAGKLNFLTMMRQSRSTISWHWLPRRFFVRAFGTSGIRIQFLHSVRKPDVAQEEDENSEYMLWQQLPAPVLRKSTRYLSLFLILLVSRVVESERLHIQCEMAMIWMAHSLWRFPSLHKDVDELISNEAWVANKLKNAGMTIWIMPLILDSTV